jgi:hypothetical protein
VEEIVRRFVMFLPIIVVAGLVTPQLPAALSDLLPPPAVDQSPIPTPVQGCCKHCRKGKACGDSCIARDETCHAGSGCACNG